MIQRETRYKRWAKTGIQIVLTVLNATSHWVPTTFMNKTGNHIVKIISMSCSRRNVMDANNQLKIITLSLQWGKNGIRDVSIAQFVAKNWIHTTFMRKKENHIVKRITTICFHRNVMDVRNQLKMAISSLLWARSGIHNVSIVPHATAIWIHTISMKRMVYHIVNAIITICSRQNVMDVNYQSLM